MCNAESLKMSEKGSNVRKDDRALPPMVLFLSALNTRMGHAKPWTSLVKHSQ